MPKKKPTLLEKFKPLEFPLNYNRSKDATKVVIDKPSSPVKGSPQDIWFEANKQKTFKPIIDPIANAVSLGNKVTTAISPNSSNAPINLTKFLERKTLVSMYGNSDKVSQATATTEQGLTQAERGVLARLALNAYNRTGSQQGGTEYEDYNSFASPHAKANILDFVKGTVNPVDATSNSFVDPVTRMSSFVGRASYTMSPNNKNVLITDKYDFKNAYSTDIAGNMKKGYLDTETGNSLIDLYRAERKTASIQDKDYNMPMPNLRFEIPISDTQYYKPSVAKRFGGRLYNLKSLRIK